VRASPRGTLGLLGLTLYVLSLLTVVLAVVDIASFFVPGIDNSPPPRIACGVLLAAAIAFAILGRRARSRASSL
jgi:hypothetical protein